MSRFKNLVGLIMAVLMLLSCFGGAFAANEAEETAPAEPKKQSAETDDIEELKGEAIAVEPQKGDVYFDPLYLISLTDAANPSEALRPVPIDEAASSFVVSRTASQTGRAVACAEISAASGTFTSTLATETMNLCLGRAYMSWSANVSTDNGATLTVRCTDTDTGATWTPFTYSYASGVWYDYSCTLSTGVSGISYSANYNIKVEFIYTYTVSSNGGSGSAPYCMLTDLQIVNVDSMDSVLNTYNSDLHFEPAADNGVDPYCSYAYPYVARSFVRLKGESGENVTCAVTAHIVAAKDDVLSFEYVSDLNYMQGAYFLFGIGTSVDDMQVLFSGENEAGDGALWNDWASWEYTIPANGEYDFIWALQTWDSEDSYVYLDNVRVTPRMSRERVLELSSVPCDAHYTDGGDTPWYPVYYKNEFCMRSGDITHNQTSTMLSEHNLLKAGDIYEYRLWMSSEQNYDFLKVYLINELTGEVSEDLAESGIYSGWAAYGTLVQKDGLYTVKFVYEKDSSVSRGDDCAYIDFAVIPSMTLTNAVAYDDHTEENLNAWDYYYEEEYHFVPTVYNGEIALVSNNNGVPNSSAKVFFTAQLAKGEVFTFDYIKDAEANWDNLTIASDIESVTIKPRSTAWQTYSVTAPAAGEYQFAVTFSKDGSVNTGTDKAYIRNVRIASLDTLLNEALQLDYQGDDYLFQYENGGCEIVYDGDGDYVTFTASGNTTDVAIGAITEGIAFDYVTFKYKTEGDAGLSFIVANYQYESQELQYNADGEWQQFYYRIPKTHSDWLFVIQADSNGGTVYLDDFYIGTLSMDFDEALLYGDGEPIDYIIDNTYNFEGVYDPLEPRGQTSYIRSRIEAGETAAIVWSEYLNPGDYVTIALHFYEETLGSTESTIELIINGESKGVYSAVELNNEYWYRLSHSENYSGMYGFELRYTSDAAAPGDAFALQCSVTRACPLDEALNVEGGAIHFYEEEGIGNFIPRIEDGRAYAIPNPSVYPDVVNEYYCDFEAAASVDGWAFVDADGDGYNWRRLDVLNNDLHSDPLWEEYVLCSDDYAMLPGAVELALTPDDWALTPEFTLPDGSGGFTLEFYFAASAPAYEGEEFSVYVGSGTDVNTYTWVKDYVMTSEYWDGDRIFIDRSMFDGDTVRVAFRHYYNSGVTGVMIDELTMTSDYTRHSQVSFDLDVQYGDTIAFELCCNASDAAYFEGRKIMVCAEGHGELMRIDAYEFAQEYGLNTWIPVSVTVPFGGHVTFSIVEEGSATVFSGLNVYLDNVEHIHSGVGNLIGDVNCDGEVSFLDVSALSLFLTGEGDLTEQGLANADFDGDGTVSFLDITALYLFLSGE